jgi:hypothetical protein
METLLLYITQLLVSFFIGMYLTVLFYTKQTLLILTHRWRNRIYVEGIKAQILALIIILFFGAFIYVFWIQGLLNIILFIIGLVIGIWFTLYFKYKV